MTEKNGSNNLTVLKLKSVENGNTYQKGKKAISNNGNIAL